MPKIEQLNKKIKEMNRHKEWKPLKICKNCKFYRGTGFWMDTTRKIHWQQVKRYGECGFMKIVFGESFPLYRSEYDKCHEYQEGEHAR